MKRRGFLKSICLVLLLISGVFFVSCKDNPPVNKVSDIAICEEFFTTPIYQNEYIDLSNYSVVVTNTIYDDETYSLDDILTNGLDTSSVGKHTFTITYRDCSKNFSYNVLPVSMIDARYIGDTLIYYKHEGADLSNQQFFVLYSDGTERRFDLSLATIVFEDLSVSDGLKTATATFEGIDFTVSYKVVTREIEDNTEYTLLDKTNNFTDCKISFSNGTYTIYTSSDNVISELVVGKITETETPNEYQTKIFIGSSRQTFILYLTKDGIVMDSLSK